MTTFGKYQLLNEIGRGPSGIVYRARDSFRDRDLALKVLRADATIGPDAKPQLIACADLRHPHIVPVNDLGEVEGAVYIEMDLPTGADLRRGLQAGLAQKLKLMAQVCDGLAFAHRKQIAHGNVKPSNIFVTEDKNARILDFGIARLPASDRLPNYLSPEQILDQPFDARSDVFSVAVVLYELIAGAYPFQAPPGLIPREIVHTEPPPLRKLDPQIPEGLERLVIQAMDKNPQRRLQTMEEFGAGLSAIAQQVQPVQAPPPTVPIFTPQPAPPRRRLVVFGVAAVLGLSTLGVLLTRPSTQASPGTVQSQVDRPTTPPPSPPPVNVETPKREPRPKRVLSGQVRTLWEAGEYARAMKLVDAVLADDPAHADARAWKQKIRAAQDAEEAIK